MIAALGLAIGIGALVKTVAVAAIPWVMSATGTIVPGVGTLHAAGGIAATLQALTMTPFNLVTGLLVGVGTGIARLILGA